MLYGIVVNAAVTPDAGRSSSLKVTGVRRGKAPPQIGFAPASGRADTRRGRANFPSSALCPQSLRLLPRRNIPDLTERTT